MRVSAWNRRGSQYVAHRRRLTTRKLASTATVDSASRSELLSDIDAEPPISKPNRPMSPHQHVASRGELLADTPDELMLCLSDIVIPEGPFLDEH